MLGGVPFTSQISSRRLPGGDHDAEWRPSLNDSAVDTMSGRAKLTTLRAAAGPLD